MAGNGGDVVEISEPTAGNEDLVVQLRQERRNYSDVFQMYKFTYSMTMSFSSGGDVILFVSDLINYHGDALQRSFEVILNTCLRNVNLQHFNRNQPIATDYMQFNVEHTDFVDYVYSSRNVRYSDFDAAQLVGGLMNWLSNLSQSERKINLTNRWIVQLSISRTDENSVPRGSGKGDQLSDKVVMEKCVVIDSAAEIDNEYVGQVTPSSFYPEEVVQLQVEEERQQHDDDDMESDDEFDDDEGTLRLFNSDAFNFMTEERVR